MTARLVLAPESATEEELAAIGRAVRHAIHMWDDGNGPDAYGVPLTVYIGRAAIAAIAARPPVTPEMLAPLIEPMARFFYQRKFPTMEDAMVDEHFAWYEQGRGRPDSCVHYSNVALAFDDARAALRKLRDMMA
jgi:hypothetical protein